MLFYLIVLPIVICIALRDEIKAYFYSKKSPEQRYKDYRKFVNEWNGTDYD